MRSRRLPALSLALIGALVSGCAADPDAASRDEPAVTPPSVRESEQPEPRLALSYDGGVVVIRAEGGEVLADLPVPGHLRLSPAGDDRHVMVSGDGGFSALDVGAWTADHGDHGHSWVDDPALTDFTVAATEPGHVVTHDGVTALFDDGSGEVTWFDSYDLADPDDAPQTRTWSTDHPHHGVAVPRHEGGFAHTDGTVEERSGIRVVDADGRTTARTDDCPGVHGEAAAREAVVFGCEDGVVVVHDDQITKVDAPDRYGRIGNQAGSETSPYVLGDYKTDADAELERPTEISVIDTERSSLRLVELGTSYTFRSLGRSGNGDGVVLGTDGALHLIDVRRARVSDTIPVLDSWREPLDWMQPRPTLEVLGRTAFVTDPSQRAVHVVDLASGTVRATHPLPVVPDEMVAVPG